MAEFATGNSDDALDIVQDSMLKLVEKYYYKSCDEWRFLFFRILQSRISDWHRRKKVRLLVSSFVEAFPFAENRNNVDDMIVAHKSTEPDITVAKDLKIDRLKTALGKLPVRQQQVFFLRVWEGFSVRETARAMSCSEGTVKTHYSRAVGSLREHLEDFE